MPTKELPLYQPIREGVFLFLKGFASKPRGALFFTLNINNDLLEPY